MPRLQEGIPVSRRRGGAASFSVRLQSTSGAAMSCVEASAADTVGAVVAQALVNEAKIHELDRLWPKLVAKYVRDTLVGLDNEDAYMQGCLELIENEGRKR